MLDKKVILPKFKTNIKCPICGKELYTSNDPEITFNCLSCSRDFNSNDITNVETGIFEVYFPLLVTEYNENTRKITTITNKAKSIYCVYDNIRHIVNVGWNIYVSKDRVYLPSDELIRETALQMSKLLKPVLSISELEEQRKNKFDELMTCIKEVLKLEPIEYDSYKEEDVYAELHNLRKTLTEYGLSEN